MIETKTFEVLDRCTFIPVVAVRLRKPYDLERARYLLGRAGYSDQSTACLVCQLQTGKSAVDPYGWGHDTRTMPNAHKFIEENWDQLTDGDVIDVEYVLNEVEKPKQSEQFVAYAF